MSQEDNIRAAGNAQGRNLIYPWLPETSPFENFIIDKVGDQNGDDWPLKPLNDVLYASVQ
jgi:hypothetical protein